MAVIKYQTDEWGGEKGCHHFEFSIKGKTFMIDVDDNSIHVNGFYVECEQVACNAVHIKINHPLRN